MSGILGFGIQRVTMTPRDSVTGLPMLVPPEIEVDASIEETHSTQIQVTRHPVFKGIPVADNGKPEPDVLSITAFFSDTKTRIDEALAVTAKAISKGITFGSSPACFATYQQLVDCAKNLALFDVETSLRPYSNMVIESIEAPRNAQNGQGLVIPIRFVEIKSATVTTSTKVPTRPPSKGAVKNVGTKAPAAVKPDLVQKTGALGTLEQVGKVAKTVIGR